jgi:hypothetical protein
MSKNTETSNQNNNVTMRSYGKSDNNSQVNLIDTNRSGAPLKAPAQEKKERGPKGKTNQEIMEELSKLENPDDSYDDEKIKYLVSEEIKEVVPNDFGYFTLFHTGNENLDLEIKNADSKGKKGPSFYTPGNFVKHLNDKLGAFRSIPHPLELILHFAKEENNHYSELGVEHAYAIREKKENKLKNPTTKKMTQNQSMKDDMKEEEMLIRNTQNSLIKVLQFEDIEKGKLDEALRKNLNYKLRKLRYEVELIKKQLDKYDSYENPQKGQVVDIVSAEPYKNLKNKSKKFLENYEKFLKEQNLTTLTSQTTLENLSTQARGYLIDFMAGIIREYQKSISDKKGVSNKGRSYIKWKTKISQLVGIWDLSNSSGIEMTATYKYLILKKFLYSRSIHKQINKEFIELPKEEGSALNLFAFATSSNSDSQPIAIFSETDTIRLVMDILVAILLLYSFFTIPFRFFLDNESKTFKLIEKFVDMYFYIDIMVTFRTAFRDKFNEDIYDIYMITVRYITTFFFIDILSTIPWYFFIIALPDNIIFLVRVIAGVLKIVRIIKLLPILNKLEQLKAANYFRLIKLLLIYFLMTHWMGCLLYSGVTDGISYDALSMGCYNQDIEKTKFTLTDL